MKLNIIDLAIGFFDPQAGLERASARQKLTALAGYHEATRRSKNRRGWREAPGPNSVVGSDAVALAPPPARSSAISTLVATY